MKPKVLFEEEYQSPKVKIRPFKLFFNSPEKLLSSQSSQSNMMKQEYSSPKTLLRKKSYLQQQQSAINTLTGNKRKRNEIFNNPGSFDSLKSKAFIKFDESDKFELEKFNADYIRNLDYQFQTPKNSLSLKKNSILLETPSPKKQRNFDLDLNAIRGTKTDEKSLSKKNKSTIESIFEQDYINLETIGTGNFGSVFKCENKIDGHLYAVKVISRKMKIELQSKALNEVKVLSLFTNQFQDSNIVRYYHAWIENKQLFLTMEYCPNSLRKIMNNRTIRDYEIRKIFRDISKALYALHSNNLVHLDIKPENILESDGNYKLGDFGLSRIAFISSYEDFDEGDARYLAPEILNVHDLEVTKADIFSLGLTLYEIITSQMSKKKRNYRQMEKDGINQEEVSFYQRKKCLFIRKAFYQQLER